MAEIQAQIAAEDLDGDGKLEMVPISGVMDSQERRWHEWRCVMRSEILIK